LFLIGEAMDQYLRQKRWVSRNKKKRKIHNLIGNALKSGKIIRQRCEICNSKNTHAHHDNYDKPFEIRWLCPKHHKEWHKKNGAGING